MLLPRTAFLDQSGQLGGAELMLLDIATRFGRRGETILFQEGPFAEALRGRGLTCHVEPLSERVAGQTREAGWMTALQAFPDLARQSGRLCERMGGFDVVYTNTPKALLLGMLAARRARVPLVHHLHDIIDGSHFSRLNRRLLVTAANRAVRVIANSNATTEAFVDAGGQRDLVRVIPNGFEVSRFESPAVEETGALRTSLRISDSWAAGVIGRLAPWKGQAVFLSALAKQPDAHGVVVGSALFTEEDRAYEVSLRERAASADLDGRVRFLGFREDVVELMFAMDAIVHCSTSPEPFGRVIVEAMLCGKPVIAAAAGGAAEIVEDGVTGFLTPPGDVDALAERLAELQKHPDQAREMGERGRVVARERYELEAVLAQTEEVVREVVVGGKV